MLNPAKILTSAPNLELIIPEIPEEEVQKPVKLSIVLPTYNESENIVPIVQHLTSLLNPVLRKDYELIVVDDNSPDRTWEIAESIVSKYPNLRVIRRTEERGLSTAAIRGWQVARGEILGIIDADLQHPPEVLLKMLLLLKKNPKVDLVVASRHVEEGGVSEWSFIRRVLSRGAQILGLIILPEVIGRVSDPMSGYFLVRRNAIANQNLSPLGYKILVEVLGRGSIRNIAEVGYVFQERQVGNSKVSWKQYVEYLRHLVRLRITLWPIGRFLRFGIVGFSGVFVDMTFFYLLSDPSTLGWNLTLSKILAAEVAIFNNFLWNDAWTFGDLSRSQQGWKKRLKRFLKFNAICSLGLFLNVAILNFAYNVLDLYLLLNGRYIANLLAIAIVTLWNFWLNMKLSWRVTQVK